MRGFPYVWYLSNFCSILIHTSLGPRPKTNPSADRFQYRTFSIIFPHVILEAIYMPDEVWGRDKGHTVLKLWGGVW